MFHTLIINLNKMVFHYNIIILVKASRIFLTWPPQMNAKIHSDSLVDLEKSLVQMI